MIARPLPDALPKPRTLALTPLVGAILACLSTGTGHAQELPVACVAGTCGNAAGFVTSGGGTASLEGSRLRIDQETDTAIFNWRSFNVGAGSTVEFQQPTSAAIALNRIFQEDP